MNTYIDYLESNLNLLEVRNIVDSRGKLTILEGGIDVPFDFKRVYFISNVGPLERRGFHAHVNLKQLAVCISGSCDFLLDDGNIKKNISLSSSSEGLLIESMIWREIFNFSTDCVLAVFADNYYDETDYIREYDNFLKMVSK